MKNLSILTLILITIGAAQQGYADTNFNCVIKKVENNTVTDTSKLVDDTQNFSHIGKLDTVSAEVSYYFASTSRDELIETIVLTDSQTGVSTFFGHNVECAHNECPTEGVDIKTGWLQLNLGKRGIYQVWCTLR